MSKQSKIIITSLALCVIGLSVPAFSPIAFAQGGFLSSILPDLSPKKSENTQNIENTQNGTALSVPEKTYSADAGLPNFADLVQNLSPAVVNIATTSKIAESPMDDYFQGQIPPEFNEIFKNLFGQNIPQNAQPQKKREVKSLGSGFVIDASGYVVTNHHVVKGADKIEVNFPNGKNYTAKVIGSDSKTDIALLKIESDKPFPFLKWGNSDTARVGEWVVAIGNPYGLSGTVTKGIISALNRDIESGPYDNFIQTDAAINRGNSGGPLFNLSGEVIGVNSAIISPSGGSVGVGFAIPSHLAQSITKQLRDTGKVERGWIGVLVQEMNADIAKSFGITDFEHGALIGEVTPKSPADTAGLQAGDVIMSVNGHKLDKMRDLPRMIAETPIGQTIDISYIRSGKTLTTQITVAKQEKSVASNTKNASGRVVMEKLGLSLMDLDDAMRKYYGMSNVPYGAFIDDADSRYDGTLRRGDIIVEIDQQSIHNVNDFVQKFDKLTNNGVNPILLKINRQGVHLYVAVRVN